MTTITNIASLPNNRYNGSGKIAIIITPGVPSFFRVTGTDLDQIKSIEWFPKNSSEILFQIRQMILVSNTEGTFMVEVLDNYLNNKDRGGKISIHLHDGRTLSFPVITYGPISLTPLYQSPNSGLITG